MFIYDNFCCDAVSGIYTVYGGSRDNPAEIGMVGQSEDVVSAHGPGRGSAYKLLPFKRTNDKRVSVEEHGERPSDARLHFRQTTHS